MVAQPFRAASVALAALFLVALLPAHGGQFRGWTTVTPPGPPPGAPAGGAPTGGGGPPGPGGAPVAPPPSPITPDAGPNSGGRPNITDGTSWQVWWEFHKDPLLERDERGAPVLPISGSDEFYLGPRREPPVRDALATSLVDRRERISPALLAALRSTDNRDIVTACLVGLAKVGIDPAGAALVPTFAGYLGDGNQEVRETAALAMGIAGRPEAVETLAALLVGGGEGRRLAGRAEVPDRTRTFAAWSLGLLAHRSTDVAIKQRVHDLLVARLRQEDERNRELRVGLVNGLGLLGLDPERSGAEKLLLWRTLEDLWAFYDRDLGKGTQLVQAHVPCAVARLLGRGTGAGHQQAKRRLLADLFPRQRRHNAILQSAAMVLGALCLPGEEHEDDAEFSAGLLRGYRQGIDQLTRYFCAVSLGRIGGDANRTALLGLHEDANKATEKPWTALALGLLGRSRLLRPGGVPDAEIGRLLLRDLQSIGNDDAQSALALALGLCGHREAGDVMLGLLDGRGRGDMLTGYLAVALALLEHAPAKDRLVDLMQASVRRPFVLQQCALALGRLGDARVVPLLQDALVRSDSTATASALAIALGRIRDRRSIDPLIEELTDAGRSKLARAFLAAALGSVGDKDALPWNTVIAVDLNYMATVDTLTNGSTGVLDIL